MSIATALSSLRKRERAIRTGLLTKGYDVGYPWKYDNDTSAIISVIGGINGRNSVRNAAIKALAEGDDSVILDNGVLDLRGFYNTTQIIRRSAFADSAAQKIVFPYLGRRLSSMTSAFAECPNLTAVTDCFIPATDDFDPKNPYALSQQLLYPRHNGRLHLSNYSFASCVNLLEMPTFTTISNMQFESGAFRYCSSLTSLGDNAYDVTNTGNAAYLFTNCSALTGINFTDFGEAKYSSPMFYTQAFSYCVNMVSAYIPYLYGFGSGAFRYCANLSVIRLHSNNVAGGTALYQTGSNMFGGCPNLLCVDCSHLGIGKIANVNASHLTAGNTAKWVFARSMEDKLSGAWLSNANLHSRIVIVDDPKELMIKYDDGTVFEYSFAQLSNTYLSGANGITADNWLSAVRNELLAHGPLSNIIEISASQYFNGVSPNFLQVKLIPNPPTKLSAVYFPCAVRHGLKMTQWQESYTDMLQGQRNIKDLLSSFPNLVYCDGMHLFGWNNPYNIDIGGVALPKAKYVYDFLGSAVAEYYDLPKARLVGSIKDSDHLKYVYAPKIEALVIGLASSSKWIHKLSGASLSDIKTLYTTYDNGNVNTTYMIRTLGIHPKALSNVENICDYRNYDFQFPQSMTMETDIAFPKLKMIRNLYAPSKPLCADVLSGVNLNGLQAIGMMDVYYLSTDCYLEFPSLQYVDTEIYANYRAIYYRPEIVNHPQMINIKLPNLLSAGGITPGFDSSNTPFKEYYPNSKLSITFDFSGKTARSEDGRIHPPVLTFAKYKPGDSNYRYHNALSTFGNLFKSVKFIFDRELSAEVLEDTPANHWRYNVDGVKWPDSLISCYQFV